MTCGHGTEIGAECFEFQKVDSAINEGFKVPLSTALHVIKMFKYQALTFHLPVCASQQELQPQQVDAFKRMMSSQLEETLPDRKNGNRGIDNTFNLLLDEFKAQGVSFKRYVVESIGLKIVTVLSDVLYYLDPHHECSCLCHTESFRKVPRIQPIQET